MADNALLTVRQGIELRPGTVFEFPIDELDEDGDYMLHAIVRDESEQYLVVYGQGTSTSVSVSTSTSTSTSLTLSNSVSTSTSVSISESISTSTSTSTSASLAGP